MTDEQYMRYALDLAKQGLGRTSPNPMVGAVVVRDGSIVGEGWHQRAGTPHAEIHALNQAGELSRGATMYVTLEPCCHYGRTGPCTDALIKAGIKRIVVAMKDPNPLVAGCGLDILRAAGLEVYEGLLAHEAAKLNETFIKWVSTNMPFVIMKTAMTLDGKIATYTGHSKWISCVDSRNYVHKLRDMYDAILVGIGTVLADDPQLTTRLENGSGKNPVRVIVDSMARTPLNSKVISDGLSKTIIAVSPQAPFEKRESFLRCGADIIEVPQDTNGLNLRELFRILAKRGITSVLVEGGAQINFSVLNDNLVDKIHCFIAPKIIGGNSAPTAVGGKGVPYIENAIKLEDITTERIGDDILISAYVSCREGRDVYRACRGIG